MSKVMGSGWWWWCSGSGQRASEPAARKPLASRGRWATAMANLPGLGQHSLAAARATTQQGTRLSLAEGCLISPKQGKV